MPRPAPPPPDLETTARNLRDVAEREAKGRGGQDHSAEVEAYHQASHEAHSKGRPSPPVGKDGKSAPSNAGNDGN